jgi:hypothetical protein
MQREDNYQRMMDIIDEVFATGKDKNQIQVTKKDMQKLTKIHPNCLSEIANENGPIIWVLMIPTTQKIMEDFFGKKISEKQILENTIPGENYSCIYLCSASTLPEFAGKGLTKKLCFEVIEKMRKSYSIENLFVWPFTVAGKKLAERIAIETGLNLFCFI